MTYFICVNCSSGEIDKPEKNPLYRATSLTSKVRRRMYKRAMRDLRGVQVKGQDALSKLNFTVNLVGTQYLSLSLPTFVIVT